MELTLEQLAGLTGGSILCGDPALLITGFAGLREAAAGDLSFFSNERFLPELRKTAATTVLVPPGIPETLRVPGVAFLQVEHPMGVFGEVVKRFRPPPRPFRPGIHPSAWVDPTARLNPEAVSIRPGAIVEAGVEIGDGTEIGPNAVVGEGTCIGRDCVLHANVTVYHGCRLGDRVFLHSGVVIGGDGFGYELKDGCHAKIEQIGFVEIGNDVEIGANTAVDRARFGRTIIGDGCKIDNLVQIAHNCVLGRHVIVVAQAGIAGSTHIGDYSIVAAQAGVAGHLDLCAHTVVLGKAGVTTCVKTPGRYMGHPARPLKEYQLNAISQRKVPRLLERVARLEAACGVSDSPGK